MNPSTVPLAAETLPPPLVFGVLSGAGVTAVLPGSAVLVVPTLLLGVAVAFGFGVAVAFGFGVGEGVGSTFGLALLE